MYSMRQGAQWQEIELLFLLLFRSAFLCCFAAVFKWGGGGGQALRGHAANTRTRASKLHDAKQVTNALAQNSNQIYTTPYGS